MAHNVLHPVGLPNKNYHKLSEKKLEKFYKDNSSKNFRTTTNIADDIMPETSQGAKSTSSKRGSSKRHVRSIVLSKTATNGLAYVQKVSNPASIDISCRSCGRAIRWQANFCPNCGETVEFPTRTFLPRPIDPNDPFLKEKKKNKTLPRNLKSSIHSAYGGDTLFPSASNKRARRANRNRKKNVGTNKPHSNMIPSFDGTDATTSHGPDNFDVIPNASGQGNPVLKEDEVEPRRFSGPNADILAILFDMKNVERASGNILEADVYNNAIKCLKSVVSKIVDVKDVNKEMKKATKKAKLAVKQIIKNRQKRVMKDGSDIMDKADILIAQRREESDNKFQLQSLKAEAMRQRLLVVLEEEQERERERETFWWSKTTQSRSVEEQKQLAAIFDQEREAASARIMMLTQSLAHRGNNGIKLNFEKEELEDSDGNGSDNENAEIDNDHEDIGTTLQNIEKELVDDGNQSGSSKNHDAKMLQRRGIEDDQTAMSMFESSIASLVDGVLDDSSNDKQATLDPNTGHLFLPSIQKSEDSTEVGVDLDAMFYESESGSLPIIDTNIRESSSQLRSNKSVGENTTEVQKQDTRKVMRNLLKPFVEDVNELEREAKIMKKKPYVLLIHDDIDESKQQKTQMEKKRQKRLNETVAQKQQRQKQVIKKREKKRAVEERQMRAKLRHESIHLRKNVNFNNKMLVRNIQVDRMRQRPRVTFGGNHKAAMAHVLDDPDSIGMIKNVDIDAFDSVQENAQTLSDQSLLNISAPSSGIFWGKSMELVDNEDIELPMQRMASTTVGGGVFWGNWVSEDGIQDLNESVNEDVDRESYGGVASSSSESIQNVHDNGVKNSNLEAKGDEDKVHPITKLIAQYRKKHLGAKLSDRINSLNLKDRSAVVGGLGKLKAKYRVLNCGNPMFTCSTKVSGSINQGKGAYAIVTVYDGGGGPDQPKLRTDLVISAYLPATSEHLVVRINRAEVAVFLNKSTDWLSANDVRDGKASMQYMRPYWQEKISPIVKRLQIHLQMIGGENYVSRDLYLDVDRCILSKTKVTLPCIDDQQEYGQDSFPKYAAVVIRIERSQTKKHPKSNEPKKYDASGTLIERELESWEIHEGPPGSEMISFAITVVTRRQNGIRDTMRKSISLASLTRYLKLPKKPMLMVAEEKLGDLCDAILKSLRFVYLSAVDGDPTDENGRFRRYSKEEAMAEAELEFIFKWSKPTRRALTFVDPNKAPSPVKSPVKTAEVEDDDLQLAEDLQIAQTSAAVHMQRMYRGFKDRTLVLNLREENLAKEKLQKAKEAEMESRECQLMHLEDVWMQNYLKELAAKELRQKELNSQFAYRIVKNNITIDGKRVSVTVNVTDKPALNIAFIVVVHDHSTKKLLLTLDEGEKLSNFIYLYLKDLQRGNKATLVKNDYALFVEMLVGYLQLFHSKKNNIMVLSMKFPELTSDESVSESQDRIERTSNTKKKQNAIIDIDAELDTTDLFLNHERKFKTPPATPAFVPTLDMESVKKSKRRRRRISLGLPERGGTPKKVNTNIDLKSKFDNAAAK